MLYTDMSDLNHFTDEFHQTFKGERGTHINSATTRSVLGTNPPTPSLSFKRSQDLSRGTKYLLPYQIPSGVEKGLAKGFVSLSGSWLTLGEPRHWAVVEHDVAGTDSAKQHLRKSPGFRLSDSSLHTVLKLLALWPNLMGSTFLFQIFI